VAVTGGAQSVVQAAAAELLGLQLHLCVLLLATRQTEHQTVRYVVQHNRFVLWNRKKKEEEWSDQYKIRKTLKKRKKK